MAIFHTEPTSPAQTRKSLTGTVWHITPPSAESPAGVPPAVGQVLAARGVVTTADADAFLTANLSTLHDPLLLPGMAEAVAAVLETLARGGRIRVFGDYDADGITSTALLVRALGALGGKIDWYLPHRIDDGYGLNIRALDEAHADGIELGITVDNGITAHEQLAHAAKIGLRMVVTDHHEPDGALPPAIAVLNPKRADNAYPFRELAGVGVAFTLLRAVCAARGLTPDAPMRFLDLVTLGTVADVVPLLGENRVLVRHGLPMLTPLSKKLGLSALLKAIGIDNCATCGDVGFQIGPRLNAAGRMAHAELALRLLLTADREEADGLAQQLCAQNTQRQEDEFRMLDQALKLVDACDLTREKVLVLDSSEWNPGIIGIVASRIVERFNR
ncbi:MAG TPA: DHH family phosphoesterase, partial [Armatimonadota bacterium]